jgi:ketosteroid isomerase-like protein
MTNDEEAVRAAAMKMYDAIEDMATGRGLDRMSDAWHHLDDVSTGHPIDNWAIGWESVWATWQVVAGFGRPDRGGGKVLEMRVFVHGDTAHAISTFKVAPAFGGARIACTNVLRKIDGQWKVVHHHADTSPEMAKAIEAMIEAGG